MAGTVLVSGGSGYIAGFLIRQLVTEGWTVHTTVRSLAKESAVRQLLAVDDSRLQVLRRRPERRRRLGRGHGRLQPCGACGLAAAHRRAQGRQRADRAGARRRAACPARGQGGRREALRHDLVGGRHLLRPRPRRAPLHRGRLDAARPARPLALHPVQDHRRARRARLGGAEGGGIEFCSINPSVVLGPVWSRDYSASVVIVQEAARRQPARSAPTSASAWSMCATWPTCMCARSRRRAWRASASSLRAAS